MEISSYDKRASQIFRTILENGKPMTSYDLIKSGFKIATVHRHLTEMAKIGEIEIFSDKNKTKDRKPYGPTLQGLSSFFDIDKKIEENLEIYYDNWIKYHDFVFCMIEAGFDEKKIEEEPKKTRVMFRKLIEFDAAVGRQIEEFAENPFSAPPEVLDFVGGILITRKKEYAKIWEDLYSFLPGFRKDVLEFNKNILNRIKEIGARKVS